MRREGPALFFALTYPTLLAWLHFLLLAGGDGGTNPFQQAAYSGGKAVQFVFPLLFVWWCDGCLPRPGRPHLAGMRTALVFSLLVVAGMLGLYFGVLRDSPLLSGTPELLRGKVGEFGVTGLPAFAALSVFIILLHSGLEEYYWRWFVFGRLRRHLRFAPAAGLSALGFMAHHVIVLAVYLPGHFWSLVAPLSFCIFAGGLFWAWLYERTGTIWAAWLSHLLVDAGVYVIGFDLLGRSGLFE